MRCPTLVGREAERALLSDALAASARGRGGVLGIVGEAGVGKTRLVAEVVGAARQRGVPVFVGRAVARPTSVPLRALAEALQPLATEVGSLDDDALAPYQGALARLLRGEQPEEPGPADTLLLGEAVVRLLAASGEPRGCLLVLEDLHWADSETLEILVYLADHVHEAPVCCLATARTGERSEAERDLRLLAERRAAQLLELPRLDDAAVDRMLDGCLASEELPGDLRRFVQERAEGVPLFVEELLAGLAASDALHRSPQGWQVVSRLVPRVPLTFAEAVGRRIDGLGPHGRTILESAGLLGRSFDATLLPAATGVDPATVTGVLDAAVRAELLAVDGGGLTFRHALSRDVVLADLLPPRRTSRAAELLDAVVAAHPRLEGDWGAIAVDLAEQAGRPDRAARLLVAQAERALEAGAVARADAALVRARELAGSDRSLHVAIDEIGARTAALAGEVERAGHLAGRVLLALPAQPGGDRRRARLVATLARAAVTAADWDGAAEHLAHLQRFLDDLDELDLRTDALALEAQVAIGQGRTDRAEASARAVVELADHGAPPAAVCEAREVLGRLARPRDTEAAREHFSAGLRTAEAHGLALWRARALHELGTIDLYTTQDDANLLAARDAAIEAGAAATLALVELHLASTAGALWDGRRGLEPARRCVELSRRLGSSTLGMGLLLLAYQHALLGDDTEAERWCSEARAAAPGDLDVEAGVHGRVRLTAALRRGACEEAFTHVDRAVAILRTAPDHAFPFRGLWALLCEVVTGDGAAARAEARAHADAGIPINTWAIELADAVAAGRAGRVAEADRLAGASLARWRDRSTMSAWGAVLLRLIGEAAITDGWGEPRSWLAEATATFDAAGYAELASSCRAVLRRAGAPVPRRGRGASEVPSHLLRLGVTTREMDVLELLTAQLTNRVIAERLHLSPRTVDRHVANLLAKTGAGDRRALARLVEPPPSG